MFAAFYTEALLRLLDVFKQLHPAWDHYIDSEMRIISKEKI